ncbi:MAG: NahK/ErcS family hybrid sensor histidine kinase/response regulator [Xanthobacteraceae bacterium]
MSLDASTGATKPDLSTLFGGRLFRKYVAFFLALVFLSLVPNSFVDIWLSYDQLRTLLVRLQSQQATFAAEKIGQFVKEIEGQMSWAIQLPLQAKTEDDWRFDAARLLRQVPAVTEIVQLDGAGKERYRTSREAMDVIGSLADLSNDPAFVQALTNKVYYGPVYFVRQSEPYMTIALAGPRPDYGVIVAQVNLKFIWDVVSQIKIGQGGEAYVVDVQARLIAHPDISLVLRNTDLSAVAHVQAARSAPTAQSNEDSEATIDLKGRKVFSTHARVPALGWLVFADLPVAEAYAPLYGDILRSAVLLLLGFAVAFAGAVFLARRMVVPIRRLREGAARIGRGDLDQRISIHSGDELEELGRQFNEMAGRLQDSYATLEAKVEERTHQLQLANEAKSRFLAAASHDLRQPLHALGLFVAQLQERTRADERKQIVAHMDAALSAMNELFNALLDISRLDAGVFKVELTSFPFARVLQRVSTTFVDAARERGLSLRVVPSAVWVQSDFVLLERILFNLVSNALRYTHAGRILVGCRRRGDRLRIEVWDTGIGIPPDQCQNIFSEFYRLGKTSSEQRGGLGLGLAIVDRLCRVLDHPVTVRSSVGKGSCFTVSVPLAEAAADTAAAIAPPARRIARSSAGLIVVIDDDQLVLQGMGGLIRSWGCNVVTGESEDSVLAQLAALKRAPDLIISDYRLAGGSTGIDAINRLRRELANPVPAFLMSGDINAEPLREAQSHGYTLMHKPVDPTKLRAVLAQHLKEAQGTAVH